METLFPVGPELPGGFIYQPDFISAAEEEQLLAQIATIELQTFIFQGYEAKRKVASFGYDWSFEKKQLTKGRDIPAFFDFLVERVASFLSLKKTAIGELLVTAYPPGAVINWHRDAPPFGLIAGISLLTDCIFKLRPHDKNKQGRKSIISLPVRRRSLYVMQGPVRTDWQHSIAPVDRLRYSITLRTLQHQPG